jgi:hypothetical protein
VPVVHQSESPVTRRHEAHSFGAQALALHEAAARPSSEMRPRAPDDAVPRHRGLRAPIPPSASPRRARPRVTPTQRARPARRSRRARAGCGARPRRRARRTPRRGPLIASAVASGAAGGGATFSGAACPLVENSSSPEAAGAAGAPAAGAAGAVVAGAVVGAAPRLGRRWLRRRAVEARRERLERLAQAALGDRPRELQRHLAHPAAPRRSSSGAPRRTRRTPLSKRDIITRSRTRSLTAS